MSDGVEMAPSGPPSESSEGSFCLVDSHSAALGAERVRALMDAIKQIQVTKKYLQLSAVEVKAGVHSTVSHLLESLRSREVWLLGQADLVLQAKDEVLRAQEDRLHQVLGALTGRLQLLSTGAVPEDELSTLLERMSELETRPLETPHMCFRSDSAALRESILAFGRIDSKGLLLDVFLGAEGEGGACSLPLAFEDYGDDEHQVLYKPIGASTLAPDLDPSRIVFNIPPILRQSKTFASPSFLSPATPAGVMRAHSGGDARAPPSLRPSQSTGVLRGCLERELGGRSTSSSIRQWLNDIQRQGEEEEGLPPHTSTFTELTHSDSAVTQTSEGRALVPGTEPKLGFFRRIRQRPLSDWLSEARALLDEQNSQARASNAGVKLKTLAAFHRVMASPYASWLQAPPGAASCFEGRRRGAAGPAGLQAQCWARLGTDNKHKWLSASSSLEAKARSMKGDLEAKASPPGEGWRSTGSPLSPLAGYLDRIGKVPMSHWMLGVSEKPLGVEGPMEGMGPVAGRGGVGWEGPGGETEGEAGVVLKEGVVSPVEAYVGRINARPAAHWLQRRDSAPGSGLSPAGSMGGSLGQGSMGGSLGQGSVEGSLGQGSMRGNLGQGLIGGRLGEGSPGPLAGYLQRTSLLSTAHWLHPERQGVVNQPLQGAFTSAKFQFQMPGSVKALISSGCEAVTSVSQGGMQGAVPLGGVEGDVTQGDVGAVVPKDGVKKYASRLTADPLTAWLLPRGSEPQQVSGSGPRGAGSRALDRVLTLPASHWLSAGAVRESNPA